MIQLDAKKIRKLLIFIISFAVVLFMTACENPEPTEPSEETPTEVIPMNLVSKINLITEQPKAYEKVEFEIEGTQLLDELEFNPFDYRQLSIKGIFQAPSGEVLSIPAFWYVDY